MGKYLDIIAQRACDISDIRDKTPPVSCTEGKEANRPDTFGRLSRFCRTFAALESRCPDRVPTDRWQWCVEDAKRFLAQWGEQAKSLGWDSRDLFGLHSVPSKSAPQLQPPVPIRCDRSDLAVAGQAGDRAHRRHGGHREQEDRQHHHLSQSQ